MSNHYSEGMKDRKDYELLELMEGLVDQYGVDRVVTFLGGVCENKACHPRQVVKDFQEPAWWFEKAGKLWNI